MKISVSQIVATLNHESVNEGNHLNSPHYKERIQQFINEVGEDINSLKSVLESKNDKRLLQISFDQRIKAKAEIEVLLKVLNNKVNDPEDVETAANMYFIFLMIPEDYNIETVHLSFTVV